MNRRQFCKAAGVYATGLLFGCGSDDEDCPECPPLEGEVRTVRIPIVGQTYQERSDNVNAQECVGFFPVVSQEGKDVVALYPTPGTQNITNGQFDGAELFNCVRGMMPVPEKNALFIVSGTSLYKYHTNSVNTNINYVPGGSANALVSLARNQQEIFCANGGANGVVWVANVVSSTTSTISTFNDGTTNFTIQPTSVTSLDGYIIVNATQSGQENKIYVSELEDATNFSTTKFATAESNPDRVRAVVAHRGTLILFGDYSTEFWYNSGNADFPFEPIAGTELDIGIATPFAWAKVMNSVGFVGQTATGNYRVYILDGYNAKPISTTAIEFAINKVKATEDSDISAYSYTDEGHEFFVITIKSATAPASSLAATYVYDTSTGLWHRRSGLGYTGLNGLTTDSIWTYAYFNQKHMGGAILYPRIVELVNGFTGTFDGSDAILRRRTTRHFSQDGRNLFYHRFELDVDPGSDANSVVTLFTSDDDGVNWVNHGTKSYANVTRGPEWFRLGYSQDRLFRIVAGSNTAPYISGAYADVTPGNF